MIAMIDTILREYDISVSALSEDSKKEFAISALQKASRTNSGGQSFAGISSSPPSILD